MPNCYIVGAKVDEGNSAFDVDVGEIYQDSYELVPGHVWVVRAPADEDTFDVAKHLGLFTGGNHEASGLVVPAIGYWGYGPKSMWNLMDSPYRGEKALRKVG